MANRRGGPRDLRDTSFGTEVTSRQMTDAEYAEGFGRPRPSGRRPSSPPAPPEGRRPGGAGGAGRKGPAQKKQNGRARKPARSAKPSTRSAGAVPHGAVDIGTAGPSEGLLVAATDGSCDPNPGAGGWAWTIDQRRWRAGHVPSTTNNAMELRALSELLAAVPADRPLLVHVDSKYALSAVCHWAPGWIANGWITSSGKPVLNRELIEALLDMAQGRQLRINWVKGHAGHPLNERADQLAANAMRAGRPAGPGWSSR